MAGKNNKRSKAAGGTSSGVTIAAAPRPDLARDTAVVNIPMRGARGKALDAEITRNVKAQRATQRAASKAIGRQVRSDMSRAKKLRAVHLNGLAAGFAKRSGSKVAEVKATVNGMSPAAQVKLFKQYVKENRAAARNAK